MRRLRYSPAVRRLVQETTLTPANLVLPLFVRSSRIIRQPIDAFAGLRPSFRSISAASSAKRQRGRRSRFGRASSIRRARQQRRPRQRFV